jgi:hypothetical protein
MGMPLAVYARARAAKKAAKKAAEKAPSETTAHIIPIHPWLHQQANIPPLFSKTSAQTALNWVRTLEQHSNLTIEVRCSEEFRYEPGPVGQALERKRKRYFGRCLHITCWRDGQYYRLGRARIYQINKYRRTFDLIGDLELPTARKGRKIPDVLSALRSRRGHWGQNVPDLLIAFAVMLCWLHEAPGRKVYLIADSKQICQTAKRSGFVTVDNRELEAKSAPSVLREIADEAEILRLVSKKVPAEIDLIKSVVTQHKDVFTVSAGFGRIQIQLGKELLAHFKAALKKRREEQLSVIPFVRYNGC